MVTELKAKFDARASFYGKAKVEMTTDGIMALISYNTKVVEIKPNEKPIIYGVLENNKWKVSPTTLRHIREFFKQTGYHQQDTKAEMLKACQFVEIRNYN